MRTLFKFLLRLAACSAGSALVEMTIIAPVAVSLAAGGVDFGMGYSTQATVGKSVRDAARYLAGLPASVACSATSTLNAQNLAVYGKLNPVSGVDLPVLPGWSVTSGNPSFTFNPSTCPEPTGNASPFTITATATYQYQSIILTSLIGTFTLSATHEEPQIGGP